MKQLLPLAFAIAIAQTIQAQQVNWFTPDAHWTFHVISGWVGNGVEKHSVGSDSTVGNFFYHKIQRETNFGLGAHSSDVRLLRQDGYKIFTRNGADEDVLLYDFALQVGNNVTVPHYWSSQSTWSYTIVETGEIQIGNTLRRKQVVQWASPIDIKSTFIEGLGEVEALHKIGGVDCLTFNYLFLDEPPMVAVDGPGRHFCSYHSATVPSFEGLGNTFCKALDAPTPGNPLDVSVFPNPNSGDFNIVGMEGESLEVALFDLAGRLVFEKTLVGSGLLSTDFRGVGALVVRSPRGFTRRQVVIF